MQKLATVGNTSFDLTASGIELLLQVCALTIKFLSKLKYILSKLSLTFYFMLENLSQSQNAKLPTHS